MNLGFLIPSDYSGVNKSFYRSIKQIVRYSPGNKVAFIIDTTFSWSYWGAESVTGAFIKSEKKVLNFPISKVRREFNTEITLGEKPKSLTKKTEPCDCQYGIWLFNREKSYGVVSYQVESECGVNCGTSYKYYYVKVFGKELYLFKKYLG